MGRTRLTNRKKEAVEEYPGTMNQPDRQFKSPEQYDTDTWETFDQQDLRHEWQEDKRDEMGFGVPSTASWKDQPTAKVKQAAAKAIKLAVCLLGDKVDDDIIEDQASDFMALGLEGINAGLDRLADTNHLFVKADDDEDDDEDSDSDKEANEKEANEKEAADNDDNDDDNDDDGNEKEAADSDDDDDDDDDDSKEASSEIEFFVKADDDDDDDDDDSKEASDIDNDGEETVAGMWMGTDDDGKPESSDQDDGRVAKTKKKDGIKKLGGQTKVASDHSDNEVNPWAGSLLDSPDVSDIFN